MSERIAFDVAAAQVSEVRCGPVFEVSTYGARGDGRTVTTGPLQAALDACAAGGGGVVRIPAGVYLTGSLVMGSGTTLRLEEGARLIGTEALRDYPLIAARWEGIETPVHRGLLSAVNARSIAIVGEGSIEGNPTAGRARPQGFNTSGSTGTSSGARGPVAIELVDCQDVRIEGITLRQGNMWTCHPLNCRDLLCRGLTVETIGLNADGIDVDSCSRVWIDRCRFSCGDDCIALKSGKGDEGRRARPTEHVLVTDCTFVASTYAAVALGSECSGGVRRVRIERCTFERAMGWGIRFKTAQGRGGFIEDVHAANIRSSAKTFLQLIMDVNNRDPQPLAGLPGITRMAGIVVEELRLGGGTFLDVVGSASKPIAGLRIRGVSGVCERGMVICSARGVELAGIEITGLPGDRLATFNVEGAGLEGARRLAAPPTSVEPGVAGNPALPPV